MGAELSSAPNTYWGSAGTEVPEQKRMFLSCAQETDLCPRAGRLKGSGLEWRERHGQLYAGSGEGQSCIGGSGMWWEREEASNQRKRMPEGDQPSYARWLATSPPVELSL